MYTNLLLLSQLWQPRDALKMKISIISFMFLSFILWIYATFHFIVSVAVVFVLLLYIFVVYLFSFTCIELLKQSYALTNILKQENISTFNYSLQI